MTRRLLLTAALLLFPALAAPAALTPVPDALAAVPGNVLIPAPQKAEFPSGTLPLKGLGLQLVGSAPELGWAARDVKAEWQVRLGTPLPDAGATSIVIGTRDDAALAARAKAAGLYTEQPEGYALWVDASGAYVVGADARGAYYGAQTLRQLLTPAGLRFALIQDYPGLRQRVAMIYLDSYSQGVNDHLIPLLAQLKYNAVLIMSDYVQWDVAKAGSWAAAGGASKAEARRVADLARSYGLEPIPLIETLGHVGWMFQGGKNLDLAQDPQSQNPYAYDTLNPETYSRVIFPVLKEAVEVFHPQRIHLGHDEVRNRDRFPARDNGKAAGFEQLFVDDVTRLHDYLKSMNVGSIIWHDAAFADAVVGSLPAKLPKDLTVASWNYSPAPDYPILSTIKDAGFTALGASWGDPLNTENYALAALKRGAAGMIQTRWTGYFGNPSLWDGQADQGVNYVRGGNSFWNPAARPLAEIDPALAEATYRDLYAPTPYAQHAGALVDLSPLVTRTLADPGEQGWIHKGPTIDLSQVPTGNVRFGAYRFLVNGAVMLKGSRAAASDLPTQATVELNRKAGRVAFLHTTGWTTPVNRELVGRYEITYADGSKRVQPLEYGRHIRAWTELTPASMVQAPGWRGQTAEGLDVNLGVLDWVNPKPDQVIKSVTLISEGKGGNPTLIGLTLIDP
ncbi:glycoside hydrolase [Deinococcus irradiatisoli]|uniref:beta-N-acetylhexosaminidase n=1 Tax=Deinococcus irradiatisoli TaxID=2202254 RepID=A0A2Z3JKQ0_9DEIO|nr:beta-N-acetylhexosaminidase [Deinococcus irradiatisoli]AWN21864.1 glycoside hydrolase [Deinococcus irradiatisoli]